MKVDAQKEKQYRRNIRESIASTRTELTPDDVMILEEMERRGLLPEGYDAASIVAGLSTDELADFVDVAREQIEAAKRRDPKAIPGLVCVAVGPDGSAEDIADQYVQRLAGQISAGFDRMLPRGETRFTIIQFIRDTVTRMKPKDPLEEMLVAQIVVAHFRSLELTRKLAINLDYPNYMEQLNSATDSALNQFRRLVLSFSAYRNPRQPAAFIKQQNQANQMVVQNGNEKNEKRKLRSGKRTKEKAAVSPQQARPALPAASGAEARAPRQAMGALDRPTNGRRQSGKRAERVEARRPSGKRATAATRGGDAATRAAKRRG